MGNDQSQDQRDRRVTFADDDYDDYDDRRPRDYPDNDRDRRDDRRPRDNPNPDRGYPRDDRRSPPNNNRNKPKDTRRPNDRYPDYNDRNPSPNATRRPNDRYPDRRRSPSLDSYDRGSPTGRKSREDTGVSLGQQIRDRARQNQPRSPSPPPRLPSPPRRNRSPPPSPPRFDTPSPPPPRPPTRAVPAHVQESQPQQSPRRPKPAPYVPTIVESPVLSPRSETSRPGKYLTPPLTPIDERSQDGRGQTPPQQASPRRNRRQGPTEKPQMSADLWGGEPATEPEQQDVIYQYYNPHNPHALQRYPGSQASLNQPHSYEPIPLDAHSQTPMTHYRRPKPKPHKPPPPRTTLEEKRRFQENVLGSFYGGVHSTPRRGTQSLRGDDEDSVNTDVSLASEGSPWRRRARKAQTQAVVDAENAEVNAYHLLGHGSSSSHPYFSQNVAVTVIKSKRQNPENGTGTPRSLPDLGDRRYEEQRHTPPQQQQRPPYQQQRQPQQQQQQRPPYQQQQQRQSYPPHRQQPLHEEDYPESDEY